MTSNEFKTHTSEEQLEELFSHRDIFDGISDENITSFKFFIRFLNPFKEEFNCTGELVYADSSTRQFSCELEKENGEWKFKSFFVRT